LKKILFFLFFAPAILHAQDYVDLLSVSYGKSFDSNFEGTPNDTSIETLEVDVLIPLVINKTYTFITGPIFNKNRFQLFPETPFVTSYSTLLKIGLATNHTDKWSSNFVFLPKIASDYREITNNDFQYGGITIFKYKKSENFSYKFGAYGSTEAFGFATTPFFGWYYKSPNKRFEMDVTLPVSIDMSYSFDSFSVGIDYIGVGRSYNINENNIGIYADQSSLKFTSYFQFNTLKKSTLLRAKLGYATNNYRAFRQGDKIDLRLPGVDINDSRLQLNQNINASFLFEVEVIYRFDLSQKK